MIPLVRTLLPNTCVSNTMSKPAHQAEVATASGSATTKSPTATPTPPHPIQRALASSKSSHTHHPKCICPLRLAAPLLRTIISTVDGHPAQLMRAFPRISGVRSARCSCYKLCSVKRWRTAHFVIISRLELCAWGPCQPFAHHVVDASLSPFVSLNPLRPSSYLFSHFPSPTVVLAALSCIPRCCPV